VLTELRRLNNPETPSVLSVLVLEDLVMAVYLPLVAVLIVGGRPAGVAVSVSIAIVVVGVLVTAVRYGNRISRLAAHQSDEIILLTIFGAVLLVAGLAQRFQVSSAIGAFLVGIAAPGRLPSNRTGCSRRFAICLPRPSFSSLGCKLTRPHYRRHYRWPLDWE